MRTSYLYLFDGQQLSDKYMVPREVEAATMDENGLRAVIAVEKDCKQCLEVYSLQGGKIQYECDAANHELEFHRRRGRLE